MRFISGLLFTALISPLAHAELADEVSDRNELRIAVQEDLPPYSFKQDGKPSGFEVELGQLLAQELEVPASFIFTDANELLSGVETGKYDMALSQVEAEPALEQRLDFSTPYADGKLAIPFPKGNPAFQAMLDNALERLRADGRLDALNDKWFTAAGAQPDASGR